MRPAAVFCPQCGVSAPSQATPSPQRHTRGFPTRLIASTLVVLLAAAVGYLGWTYVNKTSIFATTALHDINLVSGDNHDRALFFLAKTNSAALPGDIISEARSHCLEQPRIILARQKGYDAGCLIALYQNDDSPHKFTMDHENAWSFIRSSLDSGKLSGIYAWDEDLDRNRSDEMLLLDCVVFDNILQRDIICDPDKTKMSRLLGGWTNRQDVSDAAPDAAAAATAAAATAAAEAAADAAANATGGSTFYIVADANRRSQPTAASSFSGKISRGTALQGAMVIGEDGESNWLRLGDGSGYISAVNVAQSPPPQLATNLGDRRFRTPSDLQLYASPSEQSPVVDTVPAGTVLVITGITDNGFAEAKGRSGGVGYFPATGFDFSR